MGTCEVSIRLGKATPPNRFLQPRYAAMIRFKLKLLSEPIKNSHAFNLKPRILAMKSKNKSVKRRMPYDFEMELVGDDIVISSSDDCHIDNDSSTQPIHTSCMTNNARTEATELHSDSRSQVQLNKTKSQVTFGGKQILLQKGRT
ncbi:hypothetical protein Tco_1258779 [Tanacetum coccineum]